MPQEMYLALVPDLASHQLGNSNITSTVVFNCLPYADAKMSP